MKKSQNKIGQLRVWHFTNLGSKTYFFHEVKSVEEAISKLKMLADYDIVLGDLVESNAQGLEVYVGTAVDYETNNGWEEWYNDEGKDIGDVMKNE